MPCQIRVQTVERSFLALEIKAHRTAPEPPRRVHLAVIEPRGQPRLGIADALQPSFLPGNVDQGEPVGHSGNEAAIIAEADRADGFRHVPEPCIRPVVVKLPDFRTVAVDHQKPVLARVPERAFAQPRRPRPDTFDTDPASALCSVSHRSVNGLAIHRTLLLSVSLRRRVATIAKLE